MLFFNVPGEGLLILETRMRTKLDIEDFIKITGWFSPGPPVSSTNKTDHHDMTKILLKVALNTDQHYVRSA